VADVTKSNEGNYRMLPHWIKVQREDMDVFDKTTTVKKRKGLRMTEEVSWVKTQRRGLKAYDEDPSKCPSTITEERRKRLLDFGFVVYPERGPGYSNKQKRFEETYQKKIEELRRYKAEHGMFLA
jgi:hypothetical protein